MELPGSIFCEEKHLSNYIQFTQLHPRLKLPSPSLNFVTFFLSEPRSSPTCIGSSTIVGRSSDPSPHCLLPISGISATETNRRTHTPQIVRRNAPLAAVPWCAVPRRQGAMFAERRAGHSFVPPLFTTAISSRRSKPAGERMREKASIVGPCGTPRTTQGNSRTGGDAPM